jgi:hypothetical protein
MGCRGGPTKVGSTLPNEARMTMAEILGVVYGLVQDMSE